MELGGTETSVYTYMIKIFTSALCQTVYFLRCLYKCIVHFLKSVKNIKAPREEYLNLFSNKVFVTHFRWLLQLIE